MKVSQDGGSNYVVRMLGLVAFICTLVVSAVPTEATQIWNNTRVAFVKTNNADWTLGVNQDRITTNVFLTRKNSQGLFNIAQNAAYVAPGPADTEWAYGTTADLPLTFLSWTNWNGNNPASSIGSNAVLHIISQDIYIDFKLTSWTGGAGGGGFSYERAVGPRIWNGPTVSFAKGDNVDWTDPVNQDRITSKVWITRQDSEGLFNIKNEASYDSSTPSDTEWAYGTTANLDSLSFSTWYNWHGGNPPSTVGQDAVLHLISEDIFIDIKITAWTQGGGGGFSYDRAEAPLSVTINGSRIVYALLNEPFVDPGATAQTSGGVPLSVTRAGVVDTNTVGEYAVTYAAFDGLGNVGLDQLTVKVVSQLPQILNGPVATFTKNDYVDWTDAANQDRISPLVWITRQDDHGLFNIKAESSYAGTTPSDTEWAYGNVSNCFELSYSVWHDWSRLLGQTTSIVGNDAVLHLISQDIYIPIKFLSWTSGGNGGGFSYERGVAMVTLTLNGPAEKYVLLGGSFVDPGAMAVDDQSNSLPVTVTGSVDVNTLGNYFLKYSADNAGYTDTVVRVVRVVTNTPSPKVAMMPSYLQQVTYANAALNEPIMVWGRVWSGIAPYQYSINFGDGSPAATGTVTDTTFIGEEHTYASGGSKTVSLTITDDIGKVVTRQAMIKVLPTPTHEQRVNMAIEKGLIWIYRTQIEKDSDRVYWYGEDEHGVGSTGASLSSFEENGHLPGNDYEQDIYAETLQKGVNWLLDNVNVRYFNITAQHSDGIAVRDCDSNGNGKGIYLHQQTYGAAVAAMAVILSQPSALVASNTLVTSGPFVGRSYYEVVQDIYDQFSYSQGDNTHRGGWQYPQDGTDSGSFDGSAQQWPCLTFLVGAERWGLQAPQWVIDNAVWAFDQLQDPVTGGVGYGDVSNWQNTAKCGGALTAFFLGGRSVTNNLSVQKSLSFIGDKWYADPGANPNGGWAGEFYAMYGSKKGMMFQGVETVSTPSGVRNWYSDMSAWLLGHAEGSTPAGMPFIPADLRISQQTATYAFGQNADGSWATGNWPITGKELGTPHAILILTKAVTKPLPVAVIAAVGEQPDNATPFDMDGSGSYHQDSANSITEYLWDWDASDGVDWGNPDGTGVRPTNLGYSSTGTNTVTLRVKDASVPANTAVATIQVIVTSGDVAPVAIAIPPGMPAYSGRVGGIITLDGRASYDPNGDTITNYTWDLNGNNIYGDGPDVSSTNPTAMVTFSNEYVGAIGLQVTANGKSGRSVSQVEIFASSNDLRVVSVLATNIVPSVSADMQVVLLNDATSASDFSNVVVRFYNGNPLLSGSQLGSNFTVHLPRGVPVPLDVNLTGLAGVVPSNIFAFVDANLSLPEWDETNNVVRAVTEEVTPPTLDPPVMMYPVDITVSNMLARWTAVTGAAAYELDVALDTNFVTHIPGYTGLNTALARQYPVTGLSSGVWYALRARAWSSGGYSDWSNIIWVPAGNNTPYETHPPADGPVSQGAVMERILTNLFHGTGLVYSADSSDTNVATVGITSNGVLTIRPGNPGVTTIRVHAFDPHTGYTSTITFVITIVGPPQLLSGTFRHELWNPRFEQLLTVTNTSGLDAVGIRLVFTNLMAGISIENRTGTFWDGRPMIELNTAFPIGQALNLSVVYLCTGSYQVDQHPPTVEFQYILPDWKPALTGQQLMVNGWVMPDGSNRIILEFTTAVGALYAVEYMNNFPTGDWVEVPLRLRAGANRTQWIDSGPPATLPAQGTRVYRIKQLVE